jgi:3-oxoacyl-ACP reductase-like protein
MSIFGTIAKAIFGLSTAHASEAAPAAAEPVATAPPPPAATASPAAASPAATVAAAATAAIPSLSKVDVTAVMDKLASSSKEKGLDWRKSIVDLMKLLKLDSSLKARKELATELGYSGDMGDSATMNVWLHKQVMTKLAANGGNVPAELKG